MRHVRRSSIEPFEMVGKRLTNEDELGHGNRKDRGGRDDLNVRLKYRIGPVIGVGGTPFFKAGRH